MKSLKGKKVLILGATAPCVHVTKFAKEMGAYVYVADPYEEKGPAKKIADECITISTTDYSALVDIIKEHEINGVFTGPGEFNIVNAMNICKMAGLPFYCTKEQWDICQDKRNFKVFCRTHGLPVVPEFNANEGLPSVCFPVIVKPVDGCSSRGISICRNMDEYINAKKEALAVSRSKKLIVEKYVENGGVTIDAKYVVVGKGQIMLEAIGDRYVLNGGLITAISFYPSRYYDRFIEQVNPHVSSAFNSIGLHNGAFFFQAIPDGDNIYIYEMGLRVSGGMIYNLTEATSGNNTLKMLIHQCVTGEMCEKDDIKTIDPLLKGKVASTMALPLRIGTIGSMNGFDGIEKLENVVDFTSYYQVGDAVEVRHLNTLDQLFARVMVVADNYDKLFEVLQIIRNRVSVKDILGNEMIIWDTYDKIYNDFRRI